MSAIPSASRVVPSQSRPPQNLRSQVVEILSATANGCLSELGYFPGMAQRLYKAEQLNLHWRDENIKLFQDNRSLSRAITVQNERLAFVQEPETERLNRFIDLSDQVRSLTQKNAELAARNDALVRELAFLKSEFARATGAPVADSMMAVDEPAPQKAPHSDDEDDIIELDVDGLRTPASCVAAIMEEDDDDAERQLCTLCMARFQAGLTKEAPPPFIRASPNELISHCMNDHPAAWDTLRHNVGHQGNSVK